MNTAASVRANWARWLNSGALLLGAGVIVVLTLEVRALRPQVAAAKLRRAYPYPGQVVPTVRAATLNGDSVTLGRTAKGRSQTLIFFTAQCPYCLQTLPVWKRITAELLADTGRRHDVYWVTLSTPDSTAQYVAEHGITAPVVLPPEKMLRVYRVKGVPMTLVLDEWGQITHARPAVISSAASIDSVLAAARHADNLDTARTTVSRTVEPPPGRPDLKVFPGKKEGK